MDKSDSADGRLAHRRSNRSRARQVKSHKRESASDKADLLSLDELARVRSSTLKNHYVQELKSVL
jgi:hypothetical protein